MVCVHSLRGLHATLATEARATSHAVAGLGHSTPAVTHARYIDGSAKRRANSKRVVNALTPGEPEARPKRGRKRREPPLMLPPGSPNPVESTGSVGNGEQP